VSFEEGIAATIGWYRENEAWWRPIKDQTAIVTWDKK
jgi:dTDP-glucose 4,6-dehydratase